MRKGELYLWRGDPGFAAADGSGQDGSSFIVPSQDLGDTAVTDPDQDINYSPVRAGVQQNLDLLEISKIAAFLLVLN